MSPVRSAVAASSAKPGAAARDEGAPTLVAASSLARRFGAWQQQASHAPVYILNRGRARHVLMSIELMQMLCAAHAPAPPADDGGVIAALLELTDDRLLLVDAGHRLTALSQPARRLFADAAFPAMPLDRLVCASSAPLLAAAIDQAMHSGTVATTMLAAAPTPDILLAALIAPHRYGVIIKLADSPHK